MNFKMFLESIPNVSELPQMINGMLDDKWANAPIFADFLEDNSYNDEETLQWLRAGARVGSVQMYYEKVPWTLISSSGFYDALRSLKHNLGTRVNLDKDGRTLNSAFSPKSSARMLKIISNRVLDLSREQLQLGPIDSVSLSSGAHQLAMMCLNAFKH